MKQILASLTIFCHTSYKLTTTKEKKDKYSCWAWVLSSHHSNSKHSIEISFPIYEARATFITCTTSLENLESAIQ
mgnify:CR=1 FL=1